MKKIRLYIITHKIISTIILIALLGAGYWGYKKFTSTAGDTRYLTAKVEKSTIIASISGSGQVSDVNQIDIKPKVSGNVIYLGIKNGEKVTAGTLIAELDPKDAQKTVRDAEISLESSKLSLEKLKIQNSNENMDASSVKVYADGFNAVSDAFYDLNSVLTGLDNMLALNNLSDNAARMSGNTAQANRNKAQTAYYKTQNIFNQNTRDYGKLNNNSPRTDIESIIKETYDTTKLLSDAIKSASDFVDFMANDSSNPSNFTSNQTTLSTYTSTINGHLSTLQLAKTNINDNKDSLQNSSLDIRSAQLSVQQKENSLQDAKDNLADYFIRAPFAGTITNFNIKKLDSITTSTVVGTLITQQQFALISLNEVDVAKIKIGQKATLSFDAIPDLTISGIVTEIDSIGTVSQGVVTYGVKINFDTQDERVKPGMSVSTEIITDIKQDVLVVPNSAVKSQGSQSYVENFSSVSKSVPNKIKVIVGLSNDSQSEIISGIKEGDEIVTRTILSTTATATAAPSLFGSPTNRGSGNAVRTPAGR